MQILAGIEQALDHLLHRPLAQTSWWPSHEREDSPTTKQFLVHYRIKCYNTLS